MKRIIKTDKAPAAIGPYSQAVYAGGFIFISGQLPIDPATGQIVPGGIKEQTDRVLQNIRGIIADTDATFHDVVKTTVYLANMDDFAGMNEVYDKYFDSEAPARATVEVARLPKNALVEIEAVVRSAEQE